MRKFCLFPLTGNTIKTQLVAVYKQIDYHYLLMKPWQNIEPGTVVVLRDISKGYVAETIIIIHYFYILFLLYLPWTD